MQGAKLPRKREGTMSSASNLLVERGKELFRLDRTLTKFTGVPAADALLNDLDRFPHAFVLACTMDRRVRAETAWKVPYELSQRLGDFSMDTLRTVSRDQFKKAFLTPSPLHRNPNMMWEIAYEAIQRIGSCYQGDAARIWQGTPPSAELVLRFLGFRGVGAKIAAMATNILVRDFKVQLSDYHSVDVSVDVHLRRVFARLDIISEGASVEEVVYKARALNPAFPGLMDLPAWEIGRTWCKPKQPRCGACYMREVCPSRQSGRAAD